MPRALTLLLCASAALLLGLAQPKSEPRHSTVPQALLARLKCGVNLSHWWWKLSSNSTDPAAERAITPDDLALIKSAGLTHVRVPIDPALLRDTPQRLKPVAVNSLTTAVTSLHKSGLAVVLTLQPRGGSASNLDPARNPEGWEAELTSFWSLFAPLWRDAPPDKLAVELLSEPNGLTDKAEWPAAQERLRAAVRKALPRTTIILTADDWSGIDALTTLKPSADTNVIYTFHFYEPHTFTHQQAQWGSPMWQHIKGLSYPLNQPNADAALYAAQADPKAAAAVRRYIKDGWNDRVIGERLDKASAWAREHKADLYLGEFGAYRAGCDEPSRAAWLTDVASAATARKIGWCVWDYQGGYAITTRQAAGRKAIDPAVATALGLTAAKPKRP